MVGIADALKSVDAIAHTRMVTSRWGYLNCGPTLCSNEQKSQKDLQAIKKHRSRGKA